MTTWGPLYIKPIECKTTERERRAGYEYARANLHEIESPRSGNWGLFTADPTDPGAMVYSIARPGAGAESSRLATLDDTAATFDRLADLYARGARSEDSLASYYDSCDRPALADKRHKSARMHRELSAEYHAAAERIRSQWTKAR